jgi:hypothetical protein
VNPRTRKGGSLMLEQKEIDRWRRLTDAMLRHAAADDPEAFAQVVEILDRAQAKLPAVAAELTNPNGLSAQTIGGSYSWGVLGRALGVTRSAAHQRFGPNRVTVTLDD